MKIRHPWMIIAATLSIIIMGSLMYLVIPFAPSPVAYKGRFRPIAVYSKVWLKDFYNRKRIIRSHRNEYPLVKGTASDVMWRMHFMTREKFSKTS